MFFQFLFVVSSLVLGAAATPMGVVEQRQSTVPIGTPIRSCTVPGVIALTFDDGPHIYTEQLLDTLAAAGLRATFFLNGDNRGYIYDYNATVERMINEGHQVASHT
jgi:peptidoglycan/xylan/chitin deacetylase (PgdA/CDA1 family)